jgi:hypothetical protein
LKESHKVSYCGLIYNKVRGLSAKCQEIGFSRNYFADEKTRGPSPQFVDHGRLRFTMDQRHGRPRELTGARPPATPGLNVAGEGAEEVQQVAASTFVGSSELGRWGNGGAVEAAVGAR